MTSLSRSYRAGDWFGVFGEHATVVLPPTEKSRVGEIWAMVDEGAGFDEVLDALISGGLRELPGFVLVSEHDGETKVVIRGAARAHFTTGDETVTVEGSSATTWAERSLTDVTAVRIDVADALDGTDGEDLAIPAGLVRISRTDSPARAAGAPEAAPEPEPEPEPVAAPPVEEATAFYDPLAESDPEEDPDPTPSPEDEPQPLEDLGVETPMDDDPPTSPQERSLTEEAGWAQPRPEPVAPPAAVSAPPAAPVLPPMPSVEHDGHTQAGNWNPGEFARSQPGIPGQPPAPSVLSAPVARLTFSSGEVVEVDRAVIVGRAPEARRFTSTEQPRLITVPSPNQEISSTHLEIRPGAGADHGSAVVTDLGSTNGTVLVQPGLPPEDLQPGVAVQLIPGAIIDLGDGVTIQVGHG